MKIELIYIQSGRESWVEEAEDLYAKKIKNFIEFKIHGLKSSKDNREHIQKKIKNEEEKFLKQIQPSDFVIIFDEKAKCPENSIKFSERLVKELESHKRIKILIGGAFGFGPEIKSRANLKISLSNLTFNHHVAKVTILEQIYRALTIAKGLPYHNS